MKDNRLKEIGLDALLFIVVPAIIFFILYFWIIPKPNTTFIQLFLNYYLNANINQLSANIIVYCSFSFLALIILSFFKTPIKIYFGIVIFLLLPIINATIYSLLKLTGCGLSVLVCFLISFVFMYVFIYSIQSRPNIKIIIQFICYFLIITIFILITIYLLLLTPDFVLFNLIPINLGHLIGLIIGMAVGIVFSLNSRWREAHK